MKVLSEADVRDALDLDRTIELSADAFMALSTGKADIPLRTEILRPSVDGVIMVMPGLIEGKTFGLKIIANRPSEKTTELITTSMVLLFDSETLKPLGLLSSDYFTDVRTAAGLAAATDVLARKDARTHVVYGAGKLAEPSIRLIARVRPIDRLIIVGRNRARLEGLGARLKADPDLSRQSIEWELSADDAAEQADIITTVTSSTVPVCDGRRVRPGTHINVAGAFQPTWREMDDSVAGRAFYYVDAMQSCLTRAGDIAIPLESGVLERSRLRGEIGQIFAGKIPGRTSNSEITVFKSLGNAVQDLLLGADLLSTSETPVK